MDEEEEGCREVVKSAGSARERLMGGIFMGNRRDPIFTHFFPKYHDIGRVISRRRPLTFSASHHVGRAISRHFPLIFSASHLCL